MSDRDKKRKVSARRKMKQKQKTSVNMDETMDRLNRAMDVLQREHHRVLDVYDELYEFYKVGPNPEMELKSLESRKSKINCREFCVAHITHFPMEFYNVLADAVEEIELPMTWEPDVEPPCYAEQFGIEAPHWHVFMSSREDHVLLICIVRHLLKLMTPIIGKESWMIVPEA